MKKNILISLLLGSLVLVGCGEKTSSSTSKLENSTSSSTSSVLESSTSNSSMSNSSNSSTSSPLEVNSWSEEELEMLNDYLFTSNIPYISGGEFYTDFYYYYGALEYYIENPISENLDSEYEALLVEAGYEYYMSDEYNSNYYVGETENENFYLLINPYYDDYGGFTIDYYICGYIYELTTWNEILEEVDSYLGFTSNIPSLDAETYYYSYDVSYGGSINVVIPCDNPESLLETYIADFDAYEIDDSYASESYYYLENNESTFAIEMMTYCFDSTEDYDSLILYIYNL